MKNSFILEANIIGSEFAQITKFDANVKIGGGGGGT
jgi:hypothetical protein